MISFKNALCLAAFLTLGLLFNTPALADYQCCLDLDCCHHCTTCTTSETCNCTGQCPSGGCNCSCVTGGGSGGGPFPLKEGGPGGENLTAGQSVSFAGAIAQLESWTGDHFRYSENEAGTIIAMDVDPMPYEEYLHYLGSAIHALPVYRAKEDVVEFVPRNRLNKMDWSPDMQSVTSEVCANFIGATPLVALKSIAQRVGADLVVPENLDGIVDGEFLDRTWPELMEEVLVSTGPSRRVRVQPSGLVVIVR